LLRFSPGLDSPCFFWSTCYFPPPECDEGFQQGLFSPLKLRTLGKFSAWHYVTNFPFFTLTVPSTQALQTISSCFFHCLLHLTSKMIFGFQFLPQLAEPSFFFFSCEELPPPRSQEPRVPPPRQVISFFLASEYNPFSLPLIIPMSFTPFGLGFTLSPCLAGAAVSRPRGVVFGVSLSLSP